jgi:DNA-directed RNA polymerase subunit M/transcription elongation factor TFIIS
MDRIPIEYTQGKCPYCGSTDVVFHNTSTINPDESKSVPFSCQKCHKSSSDYWEYVYVCTKGHEPVEEPVVWGEDEVTIK